jgi:hypothetical protein
MEPSGRNPWQSLANGTASKTAHGKEGVSGSSPEEGFAEMPANRHFLSPVRATRGYSAGTSLVRATLRDHARTSADTVHQNLVDARHEEAPANGRHPLPSWARLRPLQGGTRPGEALQRSAPKRLGKRNTSSSRLVRPTSCPDGDRSWGPSWPPVRRHRLPSVATERLCKIVVASGNERGGARSSGSDSGGDVGCG